MPTTGEIRALCIERGWRYERPTRLTDGLWKMVIYDCIALAWVGLVYIDGIQESGPRFPGPREALEWCDEMKPRRGD